MSIPGPTSSAYPALAEPDDAVGPWARLVQRARSSELRLVPIAVALLLIWVVLAIANPAFLSSENLVNLTLQSAPTGIIALGVVVVLLVGQIDLSVGSLSGLAAAVLAVTTVEHGWPEWLGILAALGVGLVVGVFYGLLNTRLGFPSFILTIAGLLILAGTQLRVLGPKGSVNLPFDSWLVRTVQRGFCSPAVAWTIAGLVVAGYAAAEIVARVRRRRADLPYRSTARVVAQVAGLAVVVGGIVGYLGRARGIGYSVVLFVGLVVVVDVLLRRTRWGRSVRATGSDRRSAVLAGVSVRRTVLSAFVACSTFAALGGILAAGRLAAANQGTGKEVYLDAIAAAVIGGTSLFGGRGSAWSALFGVLVIQSIANGLTLMSVDPATRSIVTGAVLLLAIFVDMVIRGRREQLG